MNSRNRETRGTAARQGSSLAMFGLWMAVGWSAHSMAAAPRTRPIETKPVPPPVETPIESPAPPAQNGPVPTFQEFFAATTQTPFGSYIVEGDLALASIDQLTAYYHEKIAGQSFRTNTRRIVGAGGGGPTTNLAIKTTTLGADARWSNTDKLNLTYCIDANWHSYQSTFPHDFHYYVNEAMQLAADSWEQLINVDFKYLPANDAACHSANPNVVFRVVPWNGAPAGFVASAFFPDDPNQARYLVIATNRVPAPGGPYSLSGVLKHELGHVLGFVHEQNMANLSGCPPENVTLRQITVYDVTSVMHYRECSAYAGDFYITNTDMQGAQTVYGEWSGAPAPNAVPVARLGTPIYNGLVGRPLLIDGSGSGDPNGTALNYTWNFGDGTGTFTNNNPLGIHTFATPGTYTVTLRVDDGVLLSPTVSTTAQIRVIPLVPIINFILGD